ncbi:MAG: hypothetical protein PHT58_01105 [Eubacteriales bacterium]|nr:hypothetical protein [Eubacteriales bacterium]
MQKSRINQNQMGFAALQCIAALFFVVQIFVAKNHIASMTDYYSGSTWAETLSMFWIILAAAVLSVASGVCGILNKRILSNVLLASALALALVQFFAIKITDVFPYFITYQLGSIWPLYVGGAFLLGGLAARLFKKERNGK